MTADIDSTKREQYLSYIAEIRDEILPHQNVEFDKPAYVLTHLHLAKLYYALKEYKKSVYHLTECHGVLLRHHAVLEDIRREGCFGFKVPSVLKWEYLSCASDYAKEEDKGLFRRLSEMPSEWTIVQITRIASDQDRNISQDSNPQLKELFISRIQCGSNSDEPLVGFVQWPQSKPDNILDTIAKVKKMLSYFELKSRVMKMRNKAAQNIKIAMENLDSDLFSDWKCIFLGKLQDSNLQKSIRSRIDNILKNFSADLAPRDVQFLYLLAEGCHYFKPILIKSSLKRIFPLDKSSRLKTQLYNEIIDILSCCDELRSAKRHPVILIVEDHLDAVPWEIMPILKEQSVTRILSVHILHGLFKAHQDQIHHGLREISEDKINYYVINPDGNLPVSEAKLKPFFESRLPNWKGFVGMKPSPKDMITALTSSNAYIYCGHGSGFQLLSGTDIQKLTLKDSVQIIFGCSSAALKFLGGNVPMSGDILHYCIAGSPCSLGMLYACTNDDVDAMTMSLANHWLPGTPIDCNTLQTKPDISIEPELLRILPKIREVPNLFTNGAALISRGLPVKLKAG